MSLRPVSSELDALNRRRTLEYGATFIGLCVVFAALLPVELTITSELHTTLEVVATLMAVFVGVLSLLRFYNKKSNPYLFVGAGFIGTALLDGYSAVVTSAWFAARSAAGRADISAWSSTSADSIR